MWSDKKKTKEKDMLFVERVKEIEHITDKEEKSKLILRYAAQYAYEQKEQLFVDFLTHFKNQFNIDYKFLYRSMTHTLAGHMVNQWSSNNLKCLRYLLESGLVKTDGESWNEGLNYGIMYQNEESVRLLLSVKYLDVKQKAMREYAIENMNQESKARQLLLYLKQCCNHTQ